MKTFIAAIIIFALLFTSVLLISCFAQKRIDALLEMAEALPRDGAFAYGTVEKAERLRAEWEMNMRFLPYIVSYDILNSAGEAADALTAAARTESDGEFAAARLRFIDSVRRLRLLFSVSAESIF